MFLSWTVLVRRSSRFFFFDIFLLACVCVVVVVCVWWWWCVCVGGGGGGGGGGERPLAVAPLLSSLFIATRTVVVGGAIRCSQLLSSFILLSFRSLIAAHPLLPSSPLSSPRPPHLQPNSI